MISNQLQQLLNWAIPKMTDEGADRLHWMMENAMRGVITQVFDQRELDAFNVTNLIEDFRREKK